MLLHRVLKARHARAAVRKAAVIWPAVASGVILGTGVHWMTGTGSSGRSQVTATVLESGEPGLMRPAIGQWTTPDGEERYGVIPGLRGHAAGAERPVWIAEAGNVADAPEGQAWRITRASLAGATGTAGVILLAWPRPAGPGRWRPARGRVSAGGYR